MNPHPRRPPPLARVLLLTAAASAAFFALVTAFGYWAFTPDDSLIHLTYIRNIAAGRGFVFSGGVQSYGNTSPMWAMVHAVPVALGANPLVSMKVTAAAITVLALGGAMRVAWGAGGGLCAALCGAVLATDPWLLRWAVSGLEVSLAAAAAVWTVVFLQARRWRAAAAVAGVAPLVRPDFAPLTAMVGFILLYQAVRRTNDRSAGDERGAGRPHWSAFAILILPGLAWAAYAYRTFGTVVPNTVRVKSFGAGYDALAAAAQIAKILATAHGLLLAAGVVALAARGRRAWAAWPPVGRVVAFALPVLLVGTYLATRSWTVSRYFLGATVLAQTVAVAALLTVSRRLAAGVAAASCAVCLVVTARQLAPSVAVYSAHFPAARALPDWLNANAAAGDLVAASDVGYLGYYNRAGYVVIDTAGLVTPRLLVPLDERIRVVQSMRPRFVAQRNPTANVVAAGGPLGEAGLDPATTARAVRFVVSAELGPPGVSADQSTTMYYSLYEVDWSKVDAAATKPPPAAGTPKPAPDGP